MRPQVPPNPRKLLAAGHRGRMLTPTAGEMMCSLVIGKKLLDSHLLGPRWCYVLHVGGHSDELCSHHWLNEMPSHGDA